MDKKNKIFRNVIFCLVLITIIPSAFADFPVLTGLFHSFSSPNTVSISVSWYHNTGMNRVEIYVDGTLKKNCPGVNTCILTDTYSDGTHNYYSMGHDNTGMWQEVSPTQTFTVDNTPPSVSAFHSPSSPVEGNWITINSVANDQNGIKKMEVYVDNVLTSTCNQPSTNECPYSNSFSPGDHTYYAKAIDNGLNGFTNTGTSGIGSFHVYPDTTSPEVSIFYSPSVPISGEAVLLTASATDAYGIYDIDIMVDDQPKKVCFSNSCEYSQLYSPGQHTYYATARDNSQQRNSRTTTPGTFNVRPINNKYKIVFVPINYVDLSEFNSKVTDGVNLFKSVTLFNEGGWGDALEIVKLDTTCGCQYDQSEIGTTSLCREEALACIQAAGITNYEITVSMINQQKNSGYNYGSDPYIEVMKTTSALHDSQLLTHEILHSFKFCDIYDQDKYWGQDGGNRQTPFPWLNEDPAAPHGCTNEYPLNDGVGPPFVCNTLCTFSGPGGCGSNAGVCGKYLGGSAPPYDVDFMGMSAPWQFDGNGMPVQERAHPARLDPASYTALNNHLINYALSPGGGNNGNGGNAQAQTVMEVLYTLTDDDTVTLKSAKKTSSEVLINLMPSSTYKLEVQSSSGSVLYSINFGLSFMTSAGLQSSMNVYQKIPWSPNGMYLVIKHNQNIIRSFYMADTDNDNYPDIADNCRMVNNFDQKNTDKEIADGDSITPIFIGDSMGDACDTDDDNDGYSDIDEATIGTNPLDPCGTDGWPADLVSGSVPTSTNKVNIQDITSFLAPFRRLNSNLNDFPNNRRWDLVPGKGVSTFDINIMDLTALIAGTTGYPPMFNGTVKAFNGPECPIPP